MTGRLQDKIAVVTGASRGIGRAIAERFAAEGAVVVAASRTAPGTPLPDPIEWMAADVSKADDAEALVGQVQARHGRLDVLVNNAGIQLEKPIDQTSEDDWDRVMGVNLKGIYLCCRHAIPLMRAQGGGVIVNLGSISGQAADPNMAVYNASKAGVHGLTRSIAVDHGRDGIRCNAICPGWIMTEMSEQAFAQAADPKAAEQAAIARHPAGRLGTPRDIAALAVWLASDEASFATGQLFTLDGGLTAGSPIDPATQGYTNGPRY